MTYVIAAAGTGGHVNPALAVAEALTERGVDRGDILFIGGERFEAEAVPRAGYRFVGFELTRLRRSLSPENLRIPAVLRRTSSTMAHEIRRAGGRVVLGMSGYVTVPAAMAARRAGLPFVLQEQNAHPGIAARFAARRAIKTFLGLPGKAEDLPRSQLVGNPLRSQIAAFDRRSLRDVARRNYGIEGSSPVLGVLGGSQGARVLNEAVGRIAEVAGGIGSIIHLTGTAAFEQMERRAGGSSLPWVCLSYEPRMELFYAAADLILCRAGAMTVSELAATSSPSVLVPLARVGQTFNAQALSNVGGAEVVVEGNVGSLPAKIDALVANDRGLAAMSRAAGSTSLPSAARIIADHLIEVANA